MASIMTNTNVSKREQTFREVWGVIEKYRSIKNINMSTLAVKAHCSQPNIYRRRNNPQDISLGELLRYKDALNIPDRELAEAIIGRRIIQMEES